MKPNWKTIAPATVALALVAVAFTGIAPGPQAEILSASNYRVTVERSGNEHELHATRVTGLACASAVTRAHTGTSGGGQSIQLATEAPECGDVGITRVATDDYLQAWWTSGVSGDGDVIRVAFLTADGSAGATYELTRLALAGYGLDAVDVATPQVLTETATFTVGALKLVPEDSS